MDYVITKILVPTDFLSCSINALKLAVEIAKRQNAELHVLHAISSTAFSRVSGSYSGSYDLGEKFKTEILSELDKLRQDILKKYMDLKIEVFADIGSVCNIVKHYVNNHQIELVVMGTHGASGFKEYFIGSNAYEVIKEAGCPVLTIPESFKKPIFNTVLYPIRNVEGIEEKYYYLKPIIKQNEPAIHLLGIVDNKGDLNEQRHSLTSRLKILRAEIESENLLLDCYIINTDTVAQTILREAEDKDFDLIVINATLDKEWYKFFSGNFTQQIVNHSKRPVLSIKPDLTEEQKQEISLRRHESEVYYIPFDW